MTLIEHRETEVGVRIEAIDVGLREMATALHGMVGTATRSLAKPRSDAYDVRVDFDDIEAYSLELQRELLAAVGCPDASSSDLRFLCAALHVVRHLEQIALLAADVADLATLMRSLPTGSGTVLRVLEVGSGAVDMLDGSEVASIAPDPNFGFPQTVASRGGK